MNIQLKKAKDGRSTLACVRQDGSRTWAKLHPFFPVHDLTHCAVESVFGFTEAFFGLVAGGWEIDRFQVPGASKTMPAEALWAECIVGLFDQERGGGERLTAEKFTETLATALSKMGVAPFRSVTEAELAGVRALRADLSARWRALPPGETLSVPFPVCVSPAADPI